MASYNLRILITYVLAFVKCSSVKEHPLLTYSSFITASFEVMITLYYSFISMSMNVFINLSPPGTARTASSYSRFGD